MRDIGYNKKLWAVFALAIRSIRNALYILIAVTFEGVAAFFVSTKIWITLSYSLYLNSVLPNLFFDVTKIHGFLLPLKEDKSLFCSSHSIRCRSPPDSSLF